MALLEAALSSTLSHPNVVQTLSYSLQPLRPSEPRHDNGGGERPGGDFSGCSVGSMMFGSSMDVHRFEGGGGRGTGKDSGPSGGGSDMASSVPSGFEVQLILEHCDGGNLREALDRRDFHHSRSEALLLPGGGDGGGSCRGDGKGISARSAGMRADLPDPRTYRLDLSDLQPDLQVVLSLALDVARGMAHLHSGNVVHAGKALADRPLCLDTWPAHLSLA